MKLEDILKPVKAVDNEILRQHSKITKKWEDKGRSRYALSNLINISSSILTIFSGNPYHLGWFHGWNFGSDNLTKPYGKDFNVQENYSRAKKGNPIIKIIDKTTRLPLIITGIGFVSYGIYEIVSGIHNKDANLSEGLNHICNGISFTGVASCQYVKDSDPKLLDKSPTWKRVYDWMKEKASSLTPPPILKPVPIHITPMLKTY